MIYLHVFPLGFRDLSSFLLACNVNDATLNILKSNSLVKKEEKKELFTSFLQYFSIMISLHDILLIIIILYTGSFMSYTKRGQCLFCFDPC